MVGGSGDLGDWKTGWLRFVCVWESQGRYRKRPGPTVLTVTGIALHESNEQSMASKRTGILRFGSMDIIAVMATVTAFGEYGNMDAKAGYGSVEVDRLVGGGLCGGIMKPLIEKLIGL
jgi:hypothetical protein